MPQVPSKDAPVACPPPDGLDFAALYRAHAATVARWAAHLGGPRLDVEDLVHEVFVIAARRATTFRGDAKVTTWLYGITERVVRSARRRDRRRRWLGFLWRGDVVDSLSAAQPTPLDHLERRQAREVLYRMLDRLGDRYRTIFVLFELEGMSGEEIAVLTGTKPATVWVRLHRARALFRAELRREDGERP
jgi:RNA polymerase sigma-70 factor (ECF subfamily)